MNENKSDSENLLYNAIIDPRVEGVEDENFIKNLNESGFEEYVIQDTFFIRIDDVLPPGEVTQYDVIRIMRFEGQVMLVEMTGALLEKVLNQGIANKGTGGYLQTANVSQDESGNWFIGNNTLNLEQVYKVAINDFLLTGKENGLDYLTLENPEIKLLSQKEDIRFALINQLQTAYGNL